MIKKIIVSLLIFISIIMGLNIANSADALSIQIKVPDDYTMLNTRK
jgi:hypothetical protein